MLYGQLLSLSKQMGYYFDTNYYLSKMNNDVCKRTIINSLFKLKRNNCIKVQIDKKESNNSKRKIYIIDQKVYKTDSLGSDNCYTISNEGCCSHNKNNIKKDNIINSIISYDTDGVMLWNGVRCESKECSKEELDELNSILAEFLKVMLMNNASCRFINLIMNEDDNISKDKINVFKELIIKYLLNQIKGENINEE